jgi:hypothetical protein
MADAFLRQDWMMVTNGLWSPLYSVFLGLTMLAVNPSPEWEFSVVRLLNFGIYIAALSCFRFFLLELVRHHRDGIGKSAQQSSIIFPEWGLISLGYALFILTSIEWITLAYPGPDMVVAALVYLASAISLRLRRCSTQRFDFVFLGLVLGFGYWAKAFMFMMAFVFLAICIFVSHDWKRTAPRVGLALLIFLLISSPLILGLSVAKGYLTFGSAGRLNYAWHVNRINMFHWQGEPLGSGTPKHPTRKIFDAPAMYEFGTPFRSTYPVWYDPSYWYEGVEIHTNLLRQLGVLYGNLWNYFGASPLAHGGLIVGFLTLFMIGKCIRNITEQWSMLIPAIAAVGMYSLINLEPRYIAPFFVLFWLGIASAVRLSNMQESLRIMGSVTASVLVIVFSTVAASTFYQASFALRDKAKNYSVDKYAWEAAIIFRQSKLNPGDKVAAVGGAIDTQAKWARLARSRIVAEIPSEGEFWASSPLIKAEIIKILAKAGARFLVVYDIPTDASAPGWHRIGDTGFYAYPIRALNGENR